MSALELRPFEDQLRDMIILNRLEQAEEKGMEKGIEKTIPKLLKIMSPEEISQEYEIPLEKVLEIRQSL